MPVGFVHMRKDNYSSSYSSYRSSPPYRPPTPKYHSYGDSSLDKLGDAVKAKKQSLIDQLQVARTAYDRTADKNADWILAFSPTIIVPLIYYGTKGLITESLPYNRLKQCARLIEVVKALGTTELQELFKTLKSGNSEKLMSLLVEAYRLNQEITGYRFSSEPINQHTTF